MTLVVNIVTVALAGDMATGGKNTINKPVKESGSPAQQAIMKKKRLQQLKKLGADSESGLGVQASPLGGERGMTGG